MDEREDLLQRTYASREAHYRLLGEIDPLVLAPIMNPGLMGGPRWPDLRQAYNVIRTGNRTTVITNGLADPFDDEDEPNVGFGVEVLAETDEPCEEPMAANWVFTLVSRVSRQIVSHRSVRELIDELGTLSMELDSVAGLEDLATPERRIGLLLGIHPPKFPALWDAPAGSVRLLTVKVLFPSELAVAVEQGDAGRQLLAERFAADGAYHLSSTVRASVA